MNIEAQARDYKDDRSIFFGVYRSIDVSDLEDAFYDGAKWMQEEMVEMSVEWLQNHINDYLIDDGTTERPWLKCMFEDFRKAMGE